MDIFKEIFEKELPIDTWWSYEKRKIELAERFDVSDLMLVNDFASIYGAGEDTLSFYEIAEDLYRLQGASWLQTRFENLVEMLSHFHGLGSIYVEGPEPYIEIHDTNPAEMVGRLREMYP